MPPLYHDNYVSFLRDQVLLHDGALNYLCIDNPPVAEGLSTLIADVNGESVSLEVPAATAGTGRGDRAIELFLTRYGAGMLSMSFWIRGSIDASLLADLTAGMHLGSAWGDSGTMLRTANDANMEFGDGFDTHGFRLHECINWLTRPGAGEILPMQRSSLVFLVARLDASYNLADSATRDRLTPAIGRLANVWHSEHAGIEGQQMLGTQTVFNRRHWCVLSRGAAVHLVANQAEDEGSRAVEFNDRRLARVFSKFFFPFLLAHLQHLAIRGIAADALRIESSADGREDRVDHLRRVRDSLFDLPLNLLLDEVSNESQPQAFYQKTLDVLGVHQSTKRIQRLIESIDRSVASSQLEGMATGAAANLRHSVHMHYNLEWLETFIVSVYAVEIAHVVGDAMGFGELHHADDWRRWFVPLGLIAVAIASIVLAIFALRLIGPHREKRSEITGTDGAREHADDPYSAWRHGLVLVFGIVILLALYFGGGLWLMESGDGVLRRGQAETGQSH